MKIGIIGGGNMGGAILKGIARQHRVSVCESDTKKAAVLKKKYRVTVCDLASLTANNEIVIIAVKPQGIEPVLRTMACVGDHLPLTISIAAGVTTRYMEKILPRGARVVRTMPNLPVLIGEGVTAVVKGSKARAADLKITRQIFNAVGTTVVVKEDLIDVVTAVSGSGPAYVFLFVECLLSSARRLGLNTSAAKDLVYQTLLGSAHLLAGSKDPADVLRARVTSKGGTTEAALKVLADKKLSRIYEQALTAAARRAQQLAQ